MPVLTISVPWCHLKMAKRSARSEIHKPFSFLPPISTWTVFINTESRSVKGLQKYSVCRHVWALSSPQMLRAGVVRRLKSFFFFWNWNLPLTFPCKGKPVTKICSLFQAFCCICWIFRVIFKEDFIVPEIYFQDQAAAPIPISKAPCFLSSPPPPPPHTHTP